ncbi:zinc-binding dehydrogenase [Kineobactrum salinum]|uniref:NADH oxidase n=1 Tax=Kineobactrum salinum TaxID=2708301 RepID=A0A6C0U0C5_9GAMM|nr:zinc-binding dehydrogenase [Kineobactrum salinum]QIB64427.1 NADH oxidase [Kineobactrum salinum]
MAETGLQLRTRISDDNTLSVWLEEVPVPQPGPDEVLVEVGAAPINPSDLFLLFGPADMSRARTSGSAARPVLSADIPPQAMASVQARLGQALPAGNEGAGKVIAAGDSAAAQALLGKTVGVFGGEMFAQYRCVNVHTCLELNEETSAEEGASCFVNPMTALCMVETLKVEGHTALVHTAAASNLGQMLNRLCQRDTIPLVNIVRKPEQETLLRDQGASHVVNSEADDFKPQLQAALSETGATLAFDAIGGGKLASHILTAMEAAAASEMSEYNRYGSTTHKQLYIYGVLDPGPTLLSRNFGFAWGMGGWLLPIFLQKIGMQRGAELRARVADEIKTTFASHYTRRISLAEMLDPEVVVAYNRRATGEKYLVLPQA